MIKQRLAWFLTIILLAGMLMLGAAGCQKTSEQTDGNAVIKVVATNFPPYDFARQVGGDKVEVTMLVPPGAESHSYEPTPQDIIKIQNCDVFIYGGGDSDAWIDSILDSIDAPNMKKIAMMDCVQPVVEETVAGMEDEHDHDQKSSEAESSEAPEYDEHVWLDPQNAVKIVEKIDSTLDEIDPDNKQTYDQNTKIYTGKLNTLDGRFKDMVAGSARKTIVVGDRFPFRYLTDAYGLSYYAAFPGCSTETEPSAATVAFLIDEVKKESIPVVFHTELSNERMADSIAESTGAVKRQLNACHNVTQQDFDSGKTYLDYMNENVDVLREALY